MRSYASDIDAELHDLRGQKDARPDVYDPDPDAYGTGQSLARSLRRDGSNGIVYDSVRDPDGECVAVFRPDILSPAVQGQHYCYVWDGTAISTVYIKSEYQAS